MNADQAYTTMHLHGARIGAIIKKSRLSDKALRTFAVYCARQTLKHSEPVDPRCYLACDAAEKFASGHITAKQLVAAQNKYQVLAYTRNLDKLNAHLAALNTMLPDAKDAAYQTAKQALFAQYEYQTYHDQEAYLNKLIAMEAA